MRILGIDPGLQTTGFGVIDMEGQRLSYVASGTIRTNKMELGDLPGLCRKTRQSIPAAIRKGLERKPEIAWALLDAHDLFGMPGS